MQDHSAPNLDETTLESLERYVVAGPEALHDPESARALAGRLTVARQLRAVFVKLRTRPREETDRSLSAALMRIHLPEQGVGVPAAERERIGGHRRRGGGGAPQRRGAWLTAAALMAGVMVLALGWNAGVQYGKGHVARTASVYSTKNGERADITLPDGSRVSLNVASRLEVPADFATGHRTVRLTGQALFTVPHQAGSPFTVVAGPATARVLGTSFMMRHYTSDTTSVVAVQFGKVAVRTVVLTAARQAVVGPARVIRVQPARPSAFTFAAGVMTLDSMPLVDAIASLDRWYDVDVRVHDAALASQQIKGEFVVGSPADLANILELTFDARVVRSGRILTLYPRTE